MQSRPDLTGTFGMVASTHWLASSCGMAVLEAGGNAFDAAVAAGLVLQVVEPHMNGPAGEVNMVVWSESSASVDVICGQGVTPQTATIEHFQSLGLDTIPGIGLLAATVPGAFGAWMLLLERWGTWRLREVLRYAIEYAQNGFPVVPGLAQAIAASRQLFIEDWTTSAQIWIDHMEPVRAGSFARQPKLATTYERVIREAERRSPTREGQLRAAVDIWYRGFVAEAIDRFSTRTAWIDNSGERHSGLLAGDDMACWQASVEQPASFDYRNTTVFKTDVWGQGPVFLQQLAIVQQLDLDSVEPSSPEYIHLIVEAAKLALADREAWYGDDAPVCWSALVDDAYSAARAELVTDVASHDIRPGWVGGLKPRLPQPRTESSLPVGAGVGEPTRREPPFGDTCHLDVVDRHGNMVSATPSGGWLQSSPAIPELGFPLGTRAQMFWLQPGLPSSLRPGARPRTTLSPGLAFRDGAPWLAFGTPGGDQQDQWTVPFFLSLVHQGDSPQQAVERPVFHTEHVFNSFFPRTATPNRLVVEGRVGDATCDSLARRGHDVRKVGNWDLSRATAVVQNSGCYQAAASPRSLQAYAVGR